MAIRIPRGGCCQESTPHTRLPPESHNEHIASTHPRPLSPSLLSPKMLVANESYTDYVHDISDFEAWEITCSFPMPHCNRLPALKAIFSTTLCGISVMPRFRVCKCNHGVHPRTEIGSSPAASLPFEWCVVAVLLGNASSREAGCGAWNLCRILGLSKVAGRHVVHEGRLAREDAEDDEGRDYCQTPLVRRCYEVGDPKLNLMR